MPGGTTTQMTLLKRTSCLEFFAPPGGPATLLTEWSGQMLARGVRGHHAIIGEIMWVDDVIASAWIHGRPNSDLHYGADQPAV